MRTEAGRRASAAPKPAKRARKKRRARATSVLLRWCLLGVLGLVAFLYYQPLRTYVEKRGELSALSAEVTELRGEHIRLEARLARSATVGALTREARRLGFVEPGERLFIVRDRDIREWRRARATTIGDDG